MKSFGTSKIIAGHHNSIHQVYGLDSVVVRVETIAGAEEDIVPVFCCLRGPKFILEHYAPSPNQKLGSQCME